MTSVPLISSGITGTFVPLINVDTLTTDSTVTNFPINSYGELQVVERTKVLELKSIYGTTEIRDKYETTGAATITNVIGDAEYKLTTTTASGDVAKLSSRQYGKYVAGIEAQVGVGLRIGSPLNITGDSRVVWGLFTDNENNGLYYYYDGTGFGVGYKRDNVAIETPQSAFNVDKLDGTGKSGIDLDFTKGYIYQITFSWYGYGVLKYSVVSLDPSGTANSFLCHVVDPSGLSVKTPHMPIVVKSTNSTTTDAFDVFVSGRQYSVLGNYEPIFRLVSAFRLEEPITATFEHILSIRKKSNYLELPCYIESVSVLSDSDVLVQIRTGASLTAPSYQTPQNVSVSETGVEYDVSSTAISGGNALWSTFVSGTRNDNSTNSLPIRFELLEQQPISVVCRTISGNATISTIVKWVEEW